MGAIFAFVLSQRKTYPGMCDNRNDVSLKRNSNSEDGPVSDLEGKKTRQRVNPSSSIEFYRIKYL